MSSNAKYTISELTEKFYPIYFYRKHLDIAAKEILGLELSPHHRIVLRDWGRKKSHCIFLASRGCGKTVLTAIYFVLTSILYPKNKQMVVAGTAFRGSKMLLLEMEKIIMERLASQKTKGFARRCMADNRRVISRDPSFWSVNFSNGSIVYGVPLGLDGNTIRGLRSFAIAQDEAFLLPQRMVEAVLEPMLNVLADPTKSKEEQSIKSQSIKISTIDYTHRQFYKEFRHYTAILENHSKGVKASGNELDFSDISVFEFNVEDSFYVNEDGKKFTQWGMDHDKILEKRDSGLVDLEIWNAENKNIPMDVESGYYLMSDLEKCRNVALRKEDDIFPEALAGCSGQCVLGIDTAPASANTAFVLLKIGAYNHNDRDVSLCSTAHFGNPCPLLSGKACLMSNNTTVVYAFEKNKMRQRDRVKLIHKLMDSFNIVSIACDARGGGYELADLLRDSDYLESIVGNQAKVIYDPEKIQLQEGLPILKLYATTQNDNLIFNGYLKGLISNTNLLFPMPLRDKLKSNWLFEAYGHIESLINQLARIKAIAAGKSVKFDIETVDPNTGKIKAGKKDLYSALLYASARYRELMIEKDVQKKFEPNDLPVAVQFHLP